jgi:BTB/POZ domain
MPDLRSSTSSLQKVGSSTEVSIIPINKDRSKHVDFTIICKDRGKGTTIKYGVEKAVIASMSTFFNDLFEVCSVKGQGNKEELEMMEMDSKTIRKFLEVISGVLDACIWPIE